MIGFVLGGARSGKSRYAENWIKQYPKPWVYLATAQAFDEEMQQRIKQHQQQRSQSWETVEEGIDLEKVLSKLETKPVLIDCLTLWLTNLFMRKYDIGAITERTLSSIAHYKGPIIIVSNEIGQGIVPDNALARDFRDQAGLLHQQIAHIANRVVYMVAGIPLVVKDQLEEEYCNG